MTFRRSEQTQHPDFCFLISFCAKGNHGSWKKWLIPGIFPGQERDKEKRLRGLPDPTFPGDSLLYNARRALLQLCRVEG